MKDLLKQFKGLPKMTRFLLVLPLLAILAVCVVVAIPYALLSTLISGNIMTMFRGIKAVRDKFTDTKFLKTLKVLGKVEGIDIVALPWWSPYTPAAVFSDGSGMFKIGIKKAIYDRQDASTRFMIGHEMGHISLGHLGFIHNLMNGGKRNVEDELAADKYALDNFELTKGEILRIMRKMGPVVERPRLDYMKM
jgi:hypothetical protein